MGFIKEKLLDLIEQEEEGIDTQALQTQHLKGVRTRDIHIGLVDGSKLLFESDARQSSPNSDFYTYSFEFDATKTLTIHKQLFIYEPEYDGWDVGEKKIVAQFVSGSFTYFYQDI